MERNRGGRPRHPDILTPAEWRVLEELRDGGTNAEIAVRLGISPDTVKYHVSNMLAKLGVRTAANWRPGVPSPRRSGAACRRCSLFPPPLARWCVPWGGSR